MYNGAIYIRSSKYNEERENTLAMQQSIVNTYLESKPDIVVRDVYVDNGYSGLDFLRPGFSKMIRDIEKGLINCIVVKDLSRLGRNYIQTGIYVEYVFRKSNIRFISVCDGYDSLYATGVERYFMVPMRNYINDMYSRDISIKVKSSLKARRSVGKCTLNRVPYGYRLVKNENGDRRIEIDKEIEPIIITIYSYSLEGYSLQGISDRLNEIGVPTPLENRYSYEPNYNTPLCKMEGDKTGGNKLYKWYPNMVKRILTDEIYIGTLVQGKVKKINYKSKKREVVDDKYRYKKYNNHRAIIDRTTYEIVNRLLKYDIRHSKNNCKTHNMGGIILCGECGHIMVYRKEREDCYICGKYNRGMGCCNVRIKVKDINYIVTSYMVDIGILDKELICDKTEEKLDWITNITIPREIIAYKVKNIYVYKDKKIRMVVY